MLKIIKSYMMPIAITLGILFHNQVGILSFVIPYLIFIMLLFTYSKLSLKGLRFNKMHIYLILFQILGSVVVYFILRPFNQILAQGVMICVLAPTATAAPVIAGMLRGNVASLTAYSLISNLTVALFAPLFFSFIGYNELPFLMSVLQISKKVAVLLIAPFVIAMFINRYFPKAGNLIKRNAGLSFYLWSIALTVVTGRTVQFVIDQGMNHFWVEVSMGILALAVCLIQFLTGRKIGRKYDDTVAGGQGLGQKNTVLAIWMAQTFLNPISSIGPGAYVLWQNMFNSWQIWRERKYL